MTQPHRPIGFWLKRADEAISSAVNAALAELGLDRTRWQLLNVIATRSGITVDESAEELQGFTDAHRLERLLSVMHDEGVIDGERTLTAAGHQLHQRALQVQTQVRQRAVDGISPEEYEATLDVLQRITANLE